MVVSVLVQPNEQFDIFRILLLCREAVFELYKWFQSLQTFGNLTYFRNGVYMEVLGVKVLNQPQHVRLL